MTGSSIEALPRRRLLGGVTDGVMQWTDAARIFELCTGCGACADACPEDVFDMNRAPPMAAVAVIAGGCLEPQGISCRACEDACPELALKARPQLGGTARIEVDFDACTGCGACVSVCPVDAVEVRPNG